MAIDAILSALIPSPIRAVGTAGAGILGSVLGGFMGNKGGPTPMQQKKEELVNQLMSSLKGEGPLSGLYNTSDADFQRSFIDPMKQKFQSQIAPQIQQSYIASGQERGTGMEDALTRAGVDMDQLLNQYYFQNQQNAMNRQSNMIGNILGADNGVQPQLTGGQAAMQGLGGYLTSPGFGKGIGDIFGSFKRKGFESQQTSV